MSKSIKDLLFDVVINKVNGHFECHDRDVSSLEGFPKIVTLSVLCKYTRKLNKIYKNQKGVFDWIENNVDVSPTNIGLLA